MAIFPTDIITAFFKQIFGSFDDVASLKAGQGLGMTARTTRALLNAYLTPGADSPAIVTNDPTPANNTFYIKVGASGAGSWQPSAWVLGSVGQKSYFDKLIGEASDQSEENELFAAGYKLVIRLDILNAPSTTTTTAAPTTTTTAAPTTTTTAAPNVAPTATVALAIT